jgi:ABC-type transport system involved in multi-copper enzyme maturation permease subunit
VLLAKASASRVLIVARYEIRRALAKKKVLAGVILVVSALILGVYGFSEVMRISIVRNLPVRPDPGLAWIFTYFLPSYLLSGLAALIASGSFSEEFEKGTSETLFTKPVTRLEIFLGKVLGGYILQAFFTLLLLVLSISSTSIIFGSQQHLELAPTILIANIYSNTVFFSLALALSALTRNTLIASSVSIVLLAFLPFVSGLLIFLERSVGGGYSIIARLLPTWGASMHAYIVPLNILERALLFTPISASLYGDPLAACISVAGYSLLFISLAAYRILYSDIPRK